MAPEKNNTDITLERAELITRLQWFIRIRWLAGSTVLAVGILLHFFTLSGVHAWPIVVIGIGILLYNVIFASIERLETGLGPDILAKRAPVVAFGQIVSDLLALTALLHATGGIENPLFVYYLFHVVIATLLLPTLEVLAVVLLAITLLAVLSIAEMHGWLEHADVAVLQGNYRDWPFVSATLAGFSSAMLIAVFLGTSISKKLRQREQQIVKLTCELAAHADELELANDALRRADEAKTHFFRKVSHDLKAPLAAQQSLLRTLLLELKDLPEHSRSRIERAITRGDELIVLLGDLLTLSRTRDITRKPRRESVNPAQSVRIVLDTQEINAIEKKLTWIVEIADSIPGFHAEPDQLPTLAENLISNAIKYTPEGGQVGFRLFMRDDNLVMEVSDTGIGIAPEDQVHIGEEFYRTQQARESGSPGTGLGMTIVRSIVTSLRCHVDIRSEIGSGTTITISLPFNPFHQ